MTYAEMTPAQFASMAGCDAATAAKHHVWRIKEAIRSRADLVASGMYGAPARQPVSAAAVEAYGIPLPTWYTKVGDMYVWRPEAQ